MSEERLLEEAAEGILTDLEAAPADPWQPLRENSWIGVGVPETAGGQGASLAEAAVLARACGKTCAPAPVVEAIASAVLAALVTQGNRRLEDVIRGDTRATVIPRILPIAKSSDGTGTVAEGPWPTPWARQADVVLGLVQPAGGSGLQLVYLPAQTLEISEGSNVAGEPRDGVRIVEPVGADCSFQLVRSEDDVLAILAVLHSARQVGAVRHVHDLAVQHAKERHQFGRPIGAFQVVAHSLARGAEFVEIASSALRAAVLLDGTAQFVDSAFSARVAANTAAGQCARIAHQTFGAIGMTREHALHTFTLRLAAWRQEFLPPPFWEERLGDRVGRAGATWWEHVSAGVDRIAHVHPS